MMGFPATIQQTNRSRSRPVSQPCAIKSNPRVNTKTQEKHARTYGSSSEVGGREGKLIHSRRLPLHNRTRVFKLLRMTSTRVPPRRIQTQTLAPTPSKPTISVEEWESKAPLLDSAAKSINAIKAASENRPLPPKVTPRPPHVRTRNLPT